MPLAITLLRTGTIVTFACPALSPVVYILWTSLNVSISRKEERRAGGEEGKEGEKGVREAGENRGRN